MTTSVTRLSDLPHVIVERILAAAAPDTTSGELNRLVLVTRKWREFFFEAAAKRALQQLHVDVSAATRSAFLAARNEITLRKSYVRTVIVSHAPASVSAHQWGAMLSSATSLDELNVAQRPDPSLADLGTVIAAAGRCCPRLKSLVISNFTTTEDGEQVRAVQRDRCELFGPLFSALPKWSPHGGLRRLAISISQPFEDLQSTTEFTDQVTKWCPRLERLDGCQATVEWHDSSYASDEMWIIDLHHWQQFCARTASLTTFDWVVAPFATEFFRIWGQHNKPQMKRLCLYASTRWDWPRYFREAGAATEATILRTGYAETAAHAAAALRACPALEELHALWWCAQPAHTAMDPDIFGDEFCEELAQRCPGLRVLEIIPVDSTAASNHPIDGFTDRALYSLARLQWLTSVNVATVNVTGAGVHRLVCHALVATQAYSVYEIRVGERTWCASGDRFYMVLEDFLVLLADSPGCFALRKVHFILQNALVSPVGLDWSSAYLSTLKRLIAAAKAKHPRVKIQIFATHLTTNTFSQIEEFVLYSDANLTVKGTDHQYTEIEAGFWSRWPHDGSHYDDESDYDDESQYDDESDYDDASQYDDESGDVAWGEEDFSNNENSV